MQKRQFIAAAIGGVVAPVFAASNETLKCETGPTVLTITGAIGKGNRGPLDAVRDRMMWMQKIRFDKAQTYDFSTLDSMPATTISPTLEYDAKTHTLSGPQLSDVLDAAAGSRLPDSTLALLRAVDGYVVQVALADLRKYRFMIATHLDGATMSLGGLGPLWAMYDADRFPDMMARPLKARFGLCPWALYHIELRRV